VQTYLATGLPVLGMLDGEGARVLEESGAGLVCPSGQSELLASRVEQLLALTHAERAAMGHRGQAYCRREFGRDMVISRLEDTLAELTQADKLDRAYIY
jgi:colanic acid biosynthesis glycosyl transferase WcaI